MPTTRGRVILNKLLRAIQDMVQTTRYDNLSQKDREVFQVAVRNLYNANMDDFDEVFISYTTFCQLFPSLDRFVLGKDYLKLHRKSDLQNRMVSMNFVIEKVLNRIRGIALEGKLSRNDAALLEGWATEMHGIMREKLQLPALLPSSKPLLQPQVYYEEPPISSALLLLIFIVLWFISLFRSKKQKRTLRTAPISADPEHILLLENQLQDIYQKYIDLQSQQLAHMPAQRPMSKPKSKSKPRALSVPDRRRSTNGMNVHAFTL